MSWCGRCFNSQLGSDLDSDDDGEYEYFVNSRYICKRKRTKEKTQSTVKSSVSESGVSLSASNSQFSSSKYRKNLEPNDETSQTTSCDSDMKSSINSSQLMEARVWQVGLATVNAPANLHDSYQKSLQAPATSSSDRTADIEFNKPNSSKFILKPPAPLLSSTCSNVSRSPEKPSKFKNRPGFFQRLLGRPGRTKVLKNSRAGSASASGFKESMEQPSTAIATSTLYWTIKVKMK